MIDTNDCFCFSVLCSTGSRYSMMDTAIVSGGESQ